MQNISKNLREANSKRSTHRVILEFSSSRYRIDD
jgi:hypothetical protein